MVKVTFSMKSGITVEKMSLCAAGGGGAECSEAEALLIRGTCAEMHFGLH